jgi:hypothetical protein
MKAIIRNMMLLFLAISCNNIWAQNNKHTPTAAEYLTTNAKYHTVVMVLVVIFIGIIVYGIFLHNKILKLEKKQK